LPYLVRYHGDDLARHPFEEAGRSEGKDTVRAGYAAGDGVPLDGEGDEVGLLSDDEVLLFYLRLLPG
jgi:hypothetical protein